MIGSGLPNDTSVIFFMDQNTVFNKKGQIDIIRRPKMKTKLATEREWWCANDLPITQGPRTCLDSGNGRQPCVSQTPKVIRLIWPITWNDSSCCYFAPCFCEHTPSCNPDDLGQDKTKIFGSNDLNITKMFIFWSTELRILRCSTKQKNYKKWRD